MKSLGPHGNALCPNSQERPLLLCNPNEQWMKSFFMFYKVQNI